MASIPTKLMTFAEFEQLPDMPGHRYELRHGEAVVVPPPFHGHHKTEYRLRRLLEDAAGDAGIVTTEMGFRPMPEYEYWIADVIFLTKERWDNIPQGNLAGAPDLVAEVLSPSNTPAKMLDRRQVCLKSGCREFWVLDMDSVQVDVFNPDGHTVNYKSGQAIPLLFAPGSRLAVDAIFADTIKA